MADVEFVLNGTAVGVPADGSLLDALRERLGITSAKDGCSPQGQCGCCTVWVDGQPRVACVTPITRVAGRGVTTIEGLADAARWGAAFCAGGGSQCGFCTPGIIMRVAALDAAKRSSPDAVRRALLAHLCRCTGWHPVVASVLSASDVGGRPTTQTVRDLGAARRRAALEGGVAQDVDADVALGRGGFADDAAPADALVAVRGASGDWVVGETLADARRLSGKVQGRRTTAPVRWPVTVPPGDWVRTLQTTWVEPAYLEPDASWCAPGGTPVSPLGNGGAFGGKATSPVAAIARRLADEHGRPVRVLYTREDVVRLGPKRPPLAIGVRADGSGEVRVARTPGVAGVIQAYAPDVAVVEVDVAGPPTSIDVRAAGWAEIAAVRASLRPEGPDEVVAPSGAVARAIVDDDGTVRVHVRCGEVLDEAVLRSYCTGAAHMGLGWVRREALAVDEGGRPLDLTIRSFGILSAVDVPPIEIAIESDAGEPVAASDAVFAAVAAAAWRREAFAPAWPVAHR